MYFPYFIILYNDNFSYLSANTEIPPIRMPYLEWKGH